MGNIQQVTTVVLALGAGFAGGLSSQFFTGTPALADKMAQEPQVIRAERFEVVDQNGRVHGELGLRSDGVPILRLYDEDGNPQVGFSPKGDEGDMWSAR